MMRPEDEEMEELEEIELDGLGCIWEPKTQAEALRWYCLVLAARISPGATETVKLAESMERFVRTGKIGPLGVVK